MRPTDSLPSLLAEAADLENAHLAMGHDGTARILHELRLRLDAATHAERIVVAARGAVEEARHRPRGRPSEGTWRALVEAVEAEACRE